MAYGDNIFTAVIDENGVIWEAGTGRKRQAVGIDSQREQDYQSQISEMQGTIENYYNKLVELGVIVPPKSPEQIAQEAVEQQTILLAQLTESVKSLLGEVEVLKRGNSGYGNAIGNEPIRQNSAGTGKKPTGSKKRDAAGTENIAGNNE